LKEHQPRAEDSLQLQVMTIHYLTGHFWDNSLDLSPLPFNLLSQEVQLEIYLGPLTLKIRGGVANRRITFTGVKVIARSEQLRDRSATFE
jgi:hypothetical protein